MNEFAGKIVAISNALARKVIGKSAAESDLFLCALSQLPKDGSSTHARMKRIDLYEFLGLTSSSRGRDTAVVLDRLQKSSHVRFTKKESPEDWQGVSGHVVAGFATSEDGKEYIVEFNPLFLPHLTMLRKRFTIAELEDYVAMRSNHSKLLYLDIKSWAPKGESFYTDERLREVFGLQDNEYVRKSGTFDRYRFEHRVLFPSVEEISTTTNFKVTCEKIKSGRFVKGYQLTWVEVIRDYEGQLSLADIAPDVVTDVGIDWAHLEMTTDRDAYETVRECYDTETSRPDSHTVRVGQNNLKALEVKKVFAKLTTQDVRWIIEQVTEHGLRSITHLRELMTTAPIMSGAPQPKERPPRSQSEKSKGRRISYEREYSKDQINQLFAPIRPIEKLEEP